MSTIDPFRVPSGMIIDGEQITKINNKKGILIPSGNDTPISTGGDKPDNAGNGLEEGLIRFNNITKETEVVYDDGGTLKYKPIGGLINRVAEVYEVTLTKNQTIVQVSGANFEVDFENYEIFYENQIQNNDDYVPCTDVGVPITNGTTEYILLPEPTINDGDILKVQLLNKGVVETPVKEDNIEYLSDYAGSLPNAVNIIGTSTQTSLIIDIKPNDLLMDLEITENIILNWKAGCILDGIFTLTINGGLEAGYYQLFNSTISVIGDVKTDYILPQWFGAIGNNTTECSEAFQAAFDLAFLNAGHVYITGGEYKLSTQLNYRPYVKISGAGKRTRLRSHINNGYVLNFDVGSESTGPHGVTISELSITGNNHTGTGGGIAVTSSAHAMMIKDCWVLYFDDSGQTGIYGYGDLYYFYIINCNVQNCATAIKFDGTGAGVNNCTIINCKIGDSNNGIILTKAPVTGIIGCQIERCDQYGVYALNSNYVSIYNCWLEQNVLADIRINDSNKCIIDNIYTWRSAADAGNYSINLEATSENCIVKNSYFNNRVSGNKPIWFNGCTNCIIENCDMDDTGLIYTGTLGTNLVINSTDSGIINRTTKPHFFFGGIYLSTDIPSNVQNGVIYAAGSGLIQRVDGSDKRINALDNVHISRSAAPTTGDWLRGDVAWNNNPIAGGSIGWVCVTSGTPGTWKEFGTIAS